MNSQFILVVLELRSKCRKSSPPVFPFFAEREHSVIKASAPLDALLERFQGMMEYLPVGMYARVSISLPLIARYY